MAVVLVGVVGTVGSVHAQMQMSLTLDAIAGDDVVNIAEKATGFAISGDTGSEVDAYVTVMVGTTALTPTYSGSTNPAIWSVSVPANANYIMGTSVSVRVTGAQFVPGLVSAVTYAEVTRTLVVDLAAPSVSYTVPSSLKVGVAMTAMSPSTSDTDIDGYGATGLPPGLIIDTITGVISGTPSLADEHSASVTVTVTDEAGNPAEVPLTFPEVDKGDQVLSGFKYSPETVTFGDTAPALTAPTLTTPTGEVGTLSYTTTSAGVCTVDETSGALAIEGAGACVVTATAASTANYNEATAEFTVTVQDTLALTLDAIATDNVVNIAEKAAGFAITGATGSEAGVSVTVAVGTTDLTATSTSADPATWSVSVPAGAASITGTSVLVSVTASKSGFTSPSAVTRTLAVDLAAPSVSYTAPSSLEVGVAMTAVSPSTADTDIDAYSATGLPPGLIIDTITGVISGTPSLADEHSASVTVTVTDEAGNPAEVPLTFPEVDKGDQVLSGFKYSPETVTFGDTAPALTAPTLTTPTGEVGTLSYTTTSAGVCTVDETSGALAIEGAGACVVTATAASTANYNEATAEFTVTVQDTLALTLDAIATDNVVNIAEKAAGFAITGATGSEAGVSVTVAVGTTDLTATSTSADPATWSVSVPAGTASITGTSVLVSVTASKSGFTSPSAVTRTLAVDLAAPSVSYTAPSSLEVGVAMTAVSPSTADTDIDAYSATGLPSGLDIDAGTGVISGTPDTAVANTASVTVTVTDTAGNPAEVPLTFPKVDKGDQTLTGLEYSPKTVTFGDTAPTLTAPTLTTPTGDEDAGTLSYTTTSAGVCTVDETSGALAIEGAGACVVTATAASTDKYNEASVPFTVTVRSTLALTLDPIAGDDVVNFAEYEAGFAITGATGSDAGVSVTVTVDTTDLTAMSASADPATWSVSVPAGATYITGPSVSVSVTASKSGFASPSAVTRMLAVDLAAPSVSYTPPSSLEVGVAITAMSPSTSDTDIDAYSATGLPPGLAIDASTGVISGTPDTADPNPASATVTVRDDAGNAAEVSVVFPPVATGDQTTLTLAWLARFGRTVAGHVVDAISGRFEGYSGGGSQVTLGGQAISLDSSAGNGTFSGDAAGGDTWQKASATDTLVAFADRIAGNGAGTGRIDRGIPGGEDAANLPASRSLSERNLLLGSSFHLAFGSEEEGAQAQETRWTAWAWAASSSFDGEAEGLSVDGEVTTFTLGADAAWERWLAGVAVSLSEGEGGFRGGTEDETPSTLGTGALEGTLTSVFPYLRYEASERLSMWGILGYGTGEFALELENGERWTTDVAMQMAAAGARGVLVRAAEGGGFELAARTDAQLVWIPSDAATGSDGGKLEATRSGTSRLRVALEGSHRVELAGGQALMPSLEVGLRHDGGDAETGTGIEVGGGLNYTDPATGITVDAKARGLVVHEDAHYSEWGASGSVRIEPDGSGRGLSLSLAPAWGADSGGVERLWSAGDARGLAPDGAVEPESRLEAEMGYGFSVFDGRGVATPHAGWSRAGEDEALRLGQRLRLGASEWRLESEFGEENRTYRAGYGYQMRDLFDLGVEASRYEAVNDDAPEHGVMLQIRARW